MATWGEPEGQVPERDTTINITIVGEPPAQYPPSARLVAVVGVLGGVILAYAAGRMLTGSLYQIRAADPLVLIASTAIVAAVAALATALPARRVARVDPCVTLRDE